MFRGYLVGCFIAFSMFANAEIVDPVQLDSGLVSGISSSSSAVRSFKGLPFASPPVGKLRWQAPQPVSAWEGVRDGSDFGNVCIQADGGARGNIAVLPDSPPLSEDCLYLNVWTAAESATDERPVMLYIYGGAFTEGAGSAPLYDGEALAKKGAVVVTMNYRLGPYGFFVHPELTAESGHNASGNYGLMDMLASLKWVQDNIAAFGGDASNVTVFGQSAGAMAIAALVASPQAEGLFHRAISQSGAWMGLGMGIMGTRDAAEVQGLKAANELGANTLAELRALTSEQVTAGLRGSGMQVDGWIIPEDPSLTFAAGRQNSVDVLVGSNKDEGSFIPMGPKAEQWREQVQTRFGSSADVALEYYPASSDAVAAQSSQDSFRDGTSWHMRMYADLQAQQGNNAWVFFFAQNPPTDPTVRNLGATHASEVPYVLNNLGELPLYPDASSPTLAKQSETDLTLADLMSSYWVNFAKNGNPNAEGLPSWPAYSGRESPVMVLDAQPRPESKVIHPKWELYDELYQELMNSSF